MVGRVDDGGELTGDDVVYVYPDLETLLVGSFVNGTMVSARSSGLAGLAFDAVSGIPLLLESLDRGDARFSYEEPTPVSVRDPLLRDPMEAKTVRVSASSLPGAGLGLFAGKFLPRGSVVSFYGGVKRGSYALSPDKTPRSVYAIDNDWAAADQVIDLPSYYR